MPSCLPLIDDYRSIVLENRPLIDLRAPVEFAKGAFPHTSNLPLMNDEERHLVGIAYKKEGHTKAVELGHTLVNDEIRAQRIAAWTTHIKHYPESYLYCFRGGQRSEISQKWLAEAGYEIPRLKGGYKAFRNFLLSELDSLPQNKEIFILGGHTGSGKTILLNSLQNSIDLEGIANHRGSSFGRYATPQPTQIDFENALAYALIQYFSLGHNSVVLEDESHNIGRCYLPASLFEKMKSAPVILLKSTLEARIEITYDEYILASQDDYAHTLSKGTAMHSWIDTMRHNFHRIQKRLGNQGYRQLTALLEEAWKYQKSSGDPSRHKRWIKALLTDYYDPMYQYQIEQKKERIVFEGTAEEIVDFLSTSGHL